MYQQQAEVFVIIGRFYYGVFNGRIKNKRVQTGEQDDAGHAYALNVSTDTLLCDYVENKSAGNADGITEKISSLPKQEQERILKIMDALAAVA